MTLRQFFSDIIRFAANMYRNITTARSLARSITKFDGNNNGYKHAWEEGSVKKIKICHGESTAFFFLLTHV